MGEGRREKGEGKGEKGGRGDRNINYIALLSFTFTFLLVQKLNKNSPEVFSFSQFPFLRIRWTDKEAFILPILHTTGVVLHYRARNLKHGIVIKPRIGKRKPGFMEGIGKVEDFNYLLRKVFFTEVAYFLFNIFFLFYKGKVIDVVLSNKGKV